MSILVRFRNNVTEVVSNGEVIFTLPSGATGTELNLIEVLCKTLGHRVTYENLLT